MMGIARRAASLLRDAGRVERVRAGGPSPRPLRFETVSVSSTYDEGRNARSSRPARLAGEGCRLYRPPRRRALGRGCAEDREARARELRLQLRKTLGSEVIFHRPSGYALELDPARVDVVRFEQLVREASGAGTEQRAELLASRCRSSAAPRSPISSSSRSRRPRSGVSRSSSSLPGRSWSTELELGRHAEVVTVLEPLVAAHPYRERVRAQLMLALYRSGRQADALGAYQDARNVLVEELGIDPGDDLQELERAILRQDASLRPPRRVPPKPAPAGRDIRPSPPRPEDGHRSRR